MPGFEVRWGLCGCRRVCVCVWPLLEPVYDGCTSRYPPERLETCRVCVCGTERCTPQEQQLPPARSRSLYWSCDTSAEKTERCRVYPSWLNFFRKLTGQRVIKVTASTEGLPCAFVRKGLLVRNRFVLLLFSILKKSLNIVWYLISIFFSSADRITEQIYRLIKWTMSVLL